MSDHLVTTDRLQQYHNGAVKPLKARTAALETLAGSVSNFEVRTQGNKYTEGQYVLHEDSLHNMKVWRCKPNGWYGAWDEEGWEATSIWDEIRNMQGTTEDVETVKVKVTTNRGEGVVAGTTVTVIFDVSTGRSPQTLTLDQNGETTFGVAIGFKYWVRCDGLTGYVTPASKSYTASTKNRVIEYEYRMLGSGIYVIDNNGYETDIEVWSTANNPNAMFLKLTNSTLNPGGLAHDNSIIISVNYETADRQWCIEHKDFVRLTNFSSSATAITDYNGYQNSLNVREEASTPNARNKTYVDIYNESHQSAQVDLAGYIPTFMYAYNKTVTFMGKTVHGYVLAAGQMQQLNDNLADFNTALIKLGRPAIALNSGSRWTSTEFSSNLAWRLYNGSWYNNDKNYTSTSVLPAYDLSDIL